MIKLLNFKKILLLIFLYYFNTINVAFAYIDPGSSSVVLSFIVGILVTLGIYIKSIYYKLIAFIKKIKEKLNIKNKA